MKRAVVWVTGVLFLGGSVMAADLPLQRPAGRRGLKKKAAVEEKKQPDEIRIEETDLGRMLRRDTVNVTVATTPDGAIALDTGEGFRSVLVVQTTPEGKRVVSCIASEKAAADIFNPPATDRPAKPSKVERRQ